MILASSLPSNLRSWTQELCRQYGIRAGQRMGQHFLVDRRVLAEMVAAADLDTSLPVLEVGGGFGVLTLALLEAGCRVVVVELDRRLAEGLRKLGAAGGRLTVLEGDVLKFRPPELAAALGQPRFHAVANLPYEITGKFLEQFTWGAVTPERLTLLLQREVAERLCARPGSMSLLALSCQLKTSPRVVRFVPPAAFLPPPKVTSAIVRLDRKSEGAYAARLGEVRERDLWRVARIGFAARRKVLAGNLAAALPIPKAEVAELLVSLGYPAKVRAQELAPDHWIQLTSLLSPFLRGP